jgi:hypothetical protein
MLTEPATPLEPAAAMEPPTLTEPPLALEPPSLGLPALLEEPARLELPLVELPAAPQSSWWPNTAPPHAAANIASRHGK